MNNIVIKKEIEDAAEADDHLVEEKYSDFLARRNKLAKTITEGKELQMKPSPSHGNVDEAAESIVVKEELLDMGAETVEVKPDISTLLDSKERIVKQPKVKSSSLRLIRKNDIVAGEVL